MGGMITPTPVETPTPTPPTSNDKKLGIGVGDEYTEECILALLQELEREIDSDREPRLRSIKHNWLYWKGIFDIFWSESKKDWYTLHKDLKERKIDETTPLGKFINNYRAHGESIAAAMSAAIPKVVFPPANANKAEDIAKSRGYGKISDVIDRDNNAEFLTLQALIYLYNEPYIAGYSTYHRDRAFGTYRKPVIGLVDTPVQSQICPQCGNQSSFEIGECEICGYVGEPEVYEDVEQVPDIVAVEEIDHGKEIIEIYGAQHFYVPSYVANIEEAPFGRLEGDAPTSMLRALYPELAIDIQPDKDDYARRYRTYDDYASNKVTTATYRYWIQDWAYYSLGGDEEALKKVEHLKSKFPGGLYVLQTADKKILEVKDESLLKHWTLSRDPRCKTILAEPGGHSMVPIQDLQMECDGLTIETIRYGVSETYVDADIIAWEEFGKSEVKPGSLNPVKAPPGKNLDGSFYTPPGATLSKEIHPFRMRLDIDGQFMTGDMPAIHGGANREGGKTLGEYERTRNQALQRLSIPWRIFKNFWMTMKAKAVEDYHENMLFDEMHVQPIGNGTFKNMPITLTELSEGQVGNVLPESSEQFPTTLVQKRALLLELMSIPGPISGPLVEAMTHPENTGLLIQTLGYGEFRIPNQSDRDKELRVIAKLLQEQPTMPEPPMMNPASGEVLPPQPPGPSIPVDVDLDEHGTCAEVCRLFLISQEGEDAKINNPAGYMNVFLHFIQHKRVIEEQERMQMEKEMAIAQAQNAMGKDGERVGKDGSPRDDTRETKGNGKVAANA